MRDRSNECKNPPCANCGKERGGSMGASFWGHNFSCCSEKCGREFARLHEQKARTPEGRKWLAEKWEWLESQCNYLLTGKPFHGYPEKLASDEAEERARIAADEKRELVEALRVAADELSYWINRGRPGPNPSKEEYEMWLALGHHSSEVRKIGALLAKHEAERT